MNGESKSIAEASLIQQQQKMSLDSSIIQKPITTFIRYNNSAIPQYRPEKKKSTTIPILLTGTRSSGKSSFISFLIQSIEHTFGIKDPSKFSPFSQIPLFSNFVDNFCYEKHRKRTILPKVHRTTYSMEDEYINLVILDTPGCSQFDEEDLLSSIPKIKFTIYDFTNLQLKLTNFDIDNELLNDQSNLIIITKIDLAFINLQMTPCEIENRILNFKKLFHLNTTIYITSALTGIIFKVEKSLLSELEDILSLYKIIFNSNDDSELQTNLNTQFKFDIKIHGSFKRKYFNGLQTMKDRLQKIPFYFYIKLKKEHENFIKEINLEYKRIQNEQSNKLQKMNTINVINIELDNIWTNFGDQNNYIINFVCNKPTQYLTSLFSKYKLNTNINENIINSIKVKEEDMLQLIEKYPFNSTSNKHSFTIYNLEIESMTINNQLKKSLKILSILFRSFNYKFTESKTIKLYFNKEIELDYIIKLLRLFNPENEFLLSLPSINLLESVRNKEEKEVTIENNKILFKGCFYSNNNIVTKNIKNVKDSKSIKLNNEEMKTVNYLMYNFTNIENRLIKEIENVFKEMIKRSPFINSTLGNSVLLINELQLKQNSEHINTIKETLINTWKDCRVCILEPILNVSFIFTNIKHKELTINKLKERRFVVTKENNNTLELVLEGNIPAIEALGLEVEMNVLTEGNVLIDYKFEGWNKIPGELEICKDFKRVKNTKKDNLEQMIYEKIIKQNIQ